MFKKITILLLGILLISGCGYTKEEKAQGELYKAQGLEKAQEYIKSKYNIDYTVDEVKLNTVDNSPIPDFSPEYTGSVNIYCEADGYDFVVYSDGVRCYDNFQRDAIMKYINKSVSEAGVNAIRIDSVFGYDFDNTPYLLSEFFDGYNLSGVINSEGSSRHIISTLDSIEDIDLTSTLNTQNVAYVQYRDKDCFNKVDSPDYNIYGWPMLLDIEEEAFNVAAYKDAEEYVTFDLHSYDDFYFIITDGTYCKFNEVDLGDVSEYNGRGFIDAKQIFKAYSVDTDSSEFYVYVPVNKSNKDGEIVLKYFNEDGEIRHYKEVTWLTSDDKYLYSNVYTKDKNDLVFSVLLDRD